MENPLAQLQQHGGKLSHVDEKNMLAAISSGQDFLPRLQLFTSRSDKVSEGLVDVNNYGIVEGDEITQLEKEIDLLIIAWRPMAIDNSGEQTIVTYDPKLDENGKPTGTFAMIQDKADQPAKTGAMYGPQYLVYIPSLQKFAGWWLCSKTARNLATQVNSFIGKPATIGSRSIDNGKYKWQAPTIHQCTTEFDPPALEEIQKQYDTFMDPPEPKVDVAEEEERER